MLLHACLNYVFPAVMVMLDRPLVETFNV